MDQDELLKEINSIALQAIIQKKRQCKCRVNACYHSGQLNLAMQILIKSGFDMSKVKLLLNPNIVKV